MNSATITEPAKTTRSGHTQSGRKAAPFGSKTAPALPRREPVRADKTHHIIALVDVGWGNTVFVRGEGALLSWDIGTPLCCLGDNRWVFAYSAEDPPRVFKFLRNDTDWALGENHSPDGKEVSVHVPQFPPC